MARNILYITIFLIFISTVFLVFLKIDFKNNEIPTYPYKPLISEKLLASVRQIFKNNLSKKIEVDIPSQKMKLIENDKIVGEFTISTGSEKTPTPTGQFKVLTKSFMVYSKTPKCWLPFWVGFTPDGLYGFHEVPICSEGRKGLKEIGRPASRGCVRLRIEDSETFYKWVEIGTPVIIRVTKEN